MDDLIERKRRKRERKNKAHAYECFACGVFTYSVEKHHFPIPSRCYGTATVPLCVACHDMVDRVPLSDWPLDWAMKAINEIPREAKLFMLKTLSKQYPGVVFEPTL